MLGVTASVLDLQFAASGSVSGEEVLYYGGFDTLPIHGSIDHFRRSLGLPPGADGRRPLRTLSRGQLRSVGLEAALASAATPSSRASPGPPSSPTPARTSTTA